MLTQKELEQRFKNIGIILKERRILNNLSIEQVANQINVAVEYIEMIEEGHLVNQKKMYYTGYVVAYAKLLDLPHEKILMYISDEILSQSSSQVNNANTINNITLFNSKKTINFIIIFLLSLMIFSIVNGLRKNSQDSIILDKYKDL